MKQQKEERERDEEGWYIYPEGHYINDFHRDWMLGLKESLEETSKKKITIEQARDQAQRLHNQWLEEQELRQQKYREDKKKR